MQISTLDKLPLNKEAIVLKLTTPNPLRRRLLDLGLVQNTSIKSIYVSPSGDPKAFEFRGTLIAIRNEDAKTIQIKF